MAAALGRLASFSSRGKALAKHKDVDGVKWQCEGDKCVGKAERRASLDSYMKECRKVAAGLGKLTRFYSRGREMSQRDLDNCNRAAS